MDYLPQSARQEMGKHKATMHTEWSEFARHDDGFNSKLKEDLTIGPGDDKILDELYEKLSFRAGKKADTGELGELQHDERTIPKKLKHPAYFAIATCAEGSKLNAVPGSEEWLFWDDKRVKAMLANGQHLEEIIIPPWSIIICRGDLLHGGAKGEDGKWYLRLHMYIMRFGVITPDSINDRGGIEKRTVASSSTGYSPDVDRIRSLVQTGNNNPSGHRRSRRLRNRQQ